MFYLYIHNNLLYSAYNHNYDSNKNIIDGLFINDMHVG